jgi:hypothetical protein
MKVLKDRLHAKTDDLFTLLSEPRRVAKLPPGPDTGLFWRQAQFHTLLRRLFLVKGDLLLEFVAKPPAPKRSDIFLMTENNGFTGRIMPPRERSARD